MSEEKARPREDDVSLGAMRQEAPVYLELKELPYFIGTQEYFNCLGALITEGVKYIMENGYSWFVTDALAVIKTGHPAVRGQPFLAVKLKPTGKNEADLIIEDGDYNQLYKQHYGFTDAKKDLILFYTDNVLMLNSEY